MSVSALFGLHLRRSLSPDLMEALILAHRHAVPFTVDQLEVHTLAGGRAVDVVAAAAALAAVGIRIEWPLLAAWDLGAPPIGPAVAAYIRNRDRLAGIDLPEFVGRALQREDVVSGADAGRLRSLSP